MIEPEYTDALKAFIICYCVLAMIAVIWDAWS